MCWTTSGILGSSVGLNCKGIQKQPRLGFIRNARELKAGLYQTGEITAVSVYRALFAGYSRSWRFGCLLYRYTQTDPFMYQ